MSERISTEPASTDARSEAEETSVSPPAGRSRKGGNDSLWKRARRTLGTQNLTFLQPQSRPPGATSGPGTGPAAPSKRREQVRHAQRTHRQRTQNYIKTLETEVVRLRESDSKHIEERDNLLNQVHILKVTLIAANLSLPPGLEDPPPADQSDPLAEFDMQPATVSYSSDNANHQRLHVSWPKRTSDASNSIPAYSNPSPYAQAQSTAYQPTFKTESDFPNDFSLHRASISDRRPPRASSSVTRPFAPDTLQTAIDFVLALEHPCMAHIPYPADPDSEDPANHMMLASTPLMGRAPQNPQQNSSWTTSGAVIKELLKLSSGINLAGEMTPVEAWHRLHQHPDFQLLDSGRIESLKVELSETVKCCGFGSVVDEEIFWSALNRQLISATTGFLS